MSSNINRIIWIVLDSVGMGAMPDAEKYGDHDCNTIGHVSKHFGGLKLTNLESLGLGNIEGMIGPQSSSAPLGCYGRMAEASKGKDTTTGHWEMAGVISHEPFPTYPDGFPNEVVDAFEAAVGRKIIGNKPASGTVILDELGEEHIKTGKLIVYTSGDSVFQIAANENVVPFNELYEICEKARAILKGKHAVARVIARPFIGEKKGGFTRTANRRDFSLKPPAETVLDKLKKAGLNVQAVGKIEDIFCKQGITEAVHTSDNMDGIDRTLEYMSDNKKGLIYTNLVDFDMKWGHRNDVESYGKGLEAFDVRLKQVIDAMNDKDVLFITADHGCDPTTPGTDHTREYVPFIACGKALKTNVNLGTRNTFSDIGQTVAEIFGIENTKDGESFAKQILK
ncbi:phosphopentomutase [Clostridium oryzae]|uniref:Phosphopentomutase n=1 Tax=Clostridium oryzae TaxID=1450648 RepID=A0A1V4IKY0_9CLOT|nr:phosphopentomutase [Clostridium oryzae]OPJ60490.1 phosphopentomutase [Clostridium oryzae]